MHGLMARARGQGGFTLVEILVSMLLLGGGIFAAVGAFGDSLNGAATAQQIDVATARGMQVLEEMRAAPYGQVAVQDATDAPAMTADDPRGRLSANATKYQVPGGPTEDVVASSASSPFKSFETVTVGGQTMRIYRFVSWRDEECPIIDLSNLQSTLTQLTTLLTSSTGLLNTLTGPGGSLTSATADGSALLGNGLLGALLAPVTQLVNVVLKPLSNALTNPALLGPLTSLLGKTTQPLTGLLDLCDIPKGAIPDIGQLAVIKSTLTTLGPALNTIAPLINGVVAPLHDLLGLNLLNAVGKVLADTPPILAALPQLLVQGPAIVGILNGVVDTLGNPAQLATLATSSVSSIGTLLQFLASPNTTHNTKRISVAVWLQDRTVGYGPNKAIWLSTVVTDPTEGLL